MVDRNPAAGKAKASPPAQEPPQAKPAPQQQQPSRESGFAKMFERFGACISGVFSKIASVLPKPKPKMAAQYVPETPTQIAEKKREVQGEKFETEVDAFLKLVRARKRVSLREAASALGESEVVVEEWATILDRSGLVKLVYPGNPMESPYVVLKEPGANDNNRT